VTIMDRRAFIARGATLAGGAVVSSAALERLRDRAALASKRSDSGFGYGPPQRMPDQRGRFVLALPAGFSYVTFGDIGSPMSDGTPTPLALDGMAAFRGRGGLVRLIRNHEDRNAPGAGSLRADPADMYDPLAGGGTTTLDYDPRSRRLVRSFVSLAGSTINCAGGFGLRQRSWLTGEETIAGPESSAFTQRHGYMFEVPLDRDPGEPPRGEPLRAMGRFAHEAAATDERTGIVYETEDPGTGRGAGFYRFLPRDQRNLARGGRLQILGIRRSPQYDAREGQTPGRRLPVTWIDIPNPDPPYANDDDPNGVFQQGWRLGAAKFNRLEGCWYDDGSVFFVSTSGGDVKNGDVNADGYREGYGQVWEYRARGHSPGQLILRYESPGGEVLDSPDNLTVTPRGGLVVCEDDASSDSDLDPRAPGIVDVNRLIGFTPRGEAFVFAVNTFSGSELAGVCFSPDGRTMFVNLYGESTGTPTQHAGTGMTCAITGPWRHGPL
jgi:secreted PhoX family phosphatase